MKDPIDDENMKRLVSLLGIIVFVLIVSLIMSCGTIECMYSEASWVAHTIHFQENMNIPNCDWCADYNELIP